MDFRRPAKRVASALAVYLSGEKLAQVAADAMYEQTTGAEMRSYGWKEFAPFATTVKYASTAAAIYLTAR